MLKWLDKMLGGSGADEAAAASGGDPWLAAVRQLLAPLDEPGKGRAGLRDDIVAYLGAGSNSSVLQEVGANEQFANALGLNRGHIVKPKTPVAELYSLFEAVAAPVALRWARLLEASLAGHLSSAKMSFANGRHWPEILLMHASGSAFNVWTSDVPQVRGLSAARVESILVEDGLLASALLTVAFGTPVNASWGLGPRLLLVTGLVGFADALQHHLEVVRPLLRPAAVEQRLHVFALLAAAHDATLAELAAELAEQAVASSKQVRSAAEPLLRRAGVAALAPLRDLATAGKPEQRVFALRLLAQIAHERGFAEEVVAARALAAADKAPSVHALLAEWDAASASASSEQAAPAYVYDTPTIDWSAAANRVSAAALAAFWRDINASISKDNARSRDWHAKQAANGGRQYPLNVIPEFGADSVAALKKLLESDARRIEPLSLSHGMEWNHVSPALAKLVATEPLTPVAQFRLLGFFGMATKKNNLHHTAIKCFNALHAKSGTPTLLELAQIFEEAGEPSQSLLNAYCHSWGGSLAGDWPDADVWPYFARHVDLLIQSLGSLAERDYWFMRANLFRAVATLPVPPQAVVNALFALALGTAKTERLPAQEALANLPGKEARIVAALGDGKSEVRAIAAQWLGRLRQAETVDALEQAVEKEKNDLAKGALLDALEQLGRPVEKYLDRERLAAEAKKTLAKGLPKDLDWFPWTALPPVRWNDSRAVVPVELLQWLLVQAVKQKQPEPNAVLRKVCAMFEAHDREGFGQFVLESWLYEDVRSVAPDAAAARARSAAQSTHRYMTSHPQYHVNSPHLGRSEDEIFAAMLPAYLREPAGSAAASKGLLAIVAACAGERVAAPVQRYLKEWYGQRAAQGKALIAMLGWVEHPSATQLMLSIGSRFRTKSFQEEATRQAEALAERKGWTLAELADRTVPSAGFDDTGSLELSYGGRSFVAKLLPDFKVELFNPEAKKIASLPEPRQDDDAELAKESKKAFAAAKKSIKDIVALQVERLYEALCTERGWPYADWHAYLQQHPILRHLVQRLVWVVIDAEGRVVQSFRPLDDGTLTDRDDNEVAIDAAMRVRVAHDSLLPASEVEAWQRHLADYEIQPLFQQLGKGTYTLPADRAGADAIDSFRGHVLEAFALRGRALKLGYTRGAAEDGGWFHVYNKRFPTLGLEAVVEFTGNPLPEENRKVGLLELHFANSSGGHGKLPLAKVPKVLLSECYNDLRLIASEGSGFDADWEKTTQF